MKLITIKTNDTPKVGDVVQFNHVFYSEKILGIIEAVKDGYIGIKFFNKKENSFYNYSTPEHMDNIEVANLYVCDETAEIKEGDWYTCKENLFTPTKNYYKNFNYKDLEECSKLICTNNPSIPLPQLTKESIELIISKNGELGEFDVEINTFKESKECRGVECYIEHKVANIILKESEFTSDNFKLEQTISKTFTIKTTSESFAFQFFTLVEEFIGLTDTAKNVLVSLCSQMVFNTNCIKLNPSTRDKLCQMCGIKYQTLANTLQYLKNKGIIQINKGDCIINPEYYWKGDLKTRETVLNTNKINVNFEFSKE